MASGELPTIASRQMARIKRIRWEHFRSFTDTGWIDLPALTVIVGANASGKTSLIAPLLLLKQTIESRDASLALKTKGRYFNAGAYRDLIYAHEANRDLKLSVAWAWTETPPTPAPAVGVAPPSSLELTFRDADGGDAPDLARWHVKDVYDRAMLIRDRTDGGKYTLEGVTLPKDSPVWNDAIYGAEPEGFTFPIESVFSTVYDPRKTKKPSSEPIVAVQPALAREHQYYFSVTGFVANQTRDALDGITYLGPIREKPKRIYELGGEIPFSVGSGGQFAPELICRADDELMDHLNVWISRFGFGNRLRLKSFSEDVFSLELDRAKGSTRVNVADTGFGLSQILPLIVQGYFSEPGEMLIAEQPEIHLNPRLQGVLGDLLVDIARRGVRVVLETHSEHLILRIRRLIAEALIPAREVALYYTERDARSSTARRIPLDDAGRITADVWPRGFFEDGLSEALALATAQSLAVQRAE